MMTLLAKKKVCGVTATAHKKDEGGVTELELYKKMGFKVYDLFPQVKFPDAEEIKGSYKDFRMSIAVA